MADKKDTPLHFSFGDYGEYDENGEYGENTVNTVNTLGWNALNNAISTMQVCIAHSMYKSSLFLC